jgi:hypothetical protein
VRELGGRWGAGRLDAAGFTARCAVHGAGGGDSVTEWAVNMRWLRVAQLAAAPPSLSSAASPNQVFYNTKVDGEDNGPQR